MQNIHWAANRYAADSDSDIWAGFMGDDSPAEWAIDEVNAYLDPVTGSEVARDLSDAERITVGAALRRQIEAS
jgi:ABC-type ATPase with predicted acetyltransferase domain